MVSFTHKWNSVCVCRRSADYSYVSYWQSILLASQEKQLLKKVNGSFEEPLLYHWSTLAVKTSRKGIKEILASDLQSKVQSKLRNWVVSRSDFKRAWVPPRSCFLKHLHIDSLHNSSWAYKNSVWMGTLECAGLHDFLRVTRQFNNTNRNIGFLMSIVSIRTILLRTTETKGLAFKIQNLKGKQHFFGKVQMYFIRLCHYSQSLVVNKWDFCPESHTSGLQCLWLYSSSQ